MKIAIITPFPPYRGGISKHSENLYNELVKSEDVTIINFTRQYPDILFPGKSQYLKNPRNFNSNKVIRILDSINPFSWKKTAKIIIEKKIDKLIFRFWNPFFIPAYIFIIKYLKRKKYKIKIFAICDNASAHESFYFQKFLFKNFIKILDGVITMSNNVQTQIINLYSNIKCKTFFLPIVSDLNQKLDNNIAKNKLGLKSSCTVFLFFGLIREYKGLDIFLEAINNINPELLNSFQCLIVGESYVDIKKYKSIVKNNVSDNVKWYNEYIPDNLVNLYFSASDYVVLPYRNGSQSGIIPMAYHFDKPVISSNVNGLVELVNNNTGLIFENESIENLKNILEECIKSTKNFNGINEIKEKLSTKNYAKKILNFINE